MSTSEINMPKPNETLKEYYKRQETHFSSLAAHKMAPDSDDSDDDLTDKQIEKKEKKRGQALRKAALGEAEIAYKAALATNV
mmetsp:Transcript_5042/g.5171  ORF Transcript_5042/g.5171 Transcript_5042/m.5171 type:complete len:82 (+) Transcript_5042:69-314(+)